MINNKAEINLINAGENKFCAEKIRKKRASVAVLLILALYFFYYVYRYILRYNSTETSPTYSDTPFFFQVFKYVILVILTAGLLVSLVNSKVYRKTGTVFLLCFMVLQSAYSLLVTRNEDDAVFIICSCPAILILATSDEIDIKLIDRMCEFALNVAVIYEFIQIALYLFFGRLTALAYDTGVITDVRFGSMWDDPNGFAILLIFFIPYSFYKYRSFKRIIYVLILSLFMLLTWSLTGIFAFFAVVALLYLRRLFAHKNKAKVIVKLCIITISILAVALLIFFIAKDKVVNFILSKMGSISIHLESFDLSRISGWTFLGILPDARFVESGIISLILHGGILLLLLFYYFGYKGLYSGQYLISKLDEKDYRYPIYFGMRCYILGFLIANINLPVVYIFSNMGIFMLFVALLINNARFSISGCADDNGLISGEAILKHNSNR